MHLRERLKDSSYLLLFAYNGTGKTRLSMAFKEACKTAGGADTLYLNILSHGNYSLFEPMEMVAENKRHFSNMFKNFMQQYRFNPELFAEESAAS